MWALQTLADFVMVDFCTEIKVGSFGEFRETAEWCGRRLCAGSGEDRAVTNCKWNSKDSLVSCSFGHTVVLSDSRHFMIGFMLHFVNWWGSSSWGFIALYLDDLMLNLIDSLSCGPRCVKPCWLSITKFWCWYETNGVSRLSGVMKDSLTF